MCRLALLLSITMTLHIVAQPPGMNFGPPGMGQTRKVLEKFDANKDGWLNTEERAAARPSAKQPGGAGMRFGPMGRRHQEPAKPGKHVEPSDVKNHQSAGLYEPSVLRTLFLDFDTKDWESELEDFHGTDVDVPATLTVDGKKYPNVGIHFRGMSSYMGVGKGYKRSLNISMDLADPKQRLLGHKTLNLLNAHEDASYLSSVLYSHIARQYMPAPKANLVKVVINGENWGIYANVEQFNKEFLQENFKTTKGMRWKVSGSPMARGGLEYLGEDPASYKRLYEIKSNDNDKSWKALINLCKVLNQTPAERLEEALKPILDIEEVLWFLAIDNALINCDGYWIRSSDYSIYGDEKGKFRVLPHDMNEAFRQPGGPGLGGGMMMRLTPGEILPLPMQNELKLTDAQKKELASLQKDAETKVAKILNKKQQDQWKAIKSNSGGPPGITMGGPPGSGSMARVKGIELDPLVGLTDANKPLRSKLLAVPSLRAKYLQNIKTLAQKSLDWKSLEPLVKQYHDLIDKEVEADTHKLESYEDFKKMFAATVSVDRTPRMGPPGAMNLQAFFEQRRKYLLDYQPKP